MRRITYPRPCSQCGAVLPEEDFYLKNKKTGQRFSWCKRCHRLRTHAWERENREAINAKRRAAYAATHEPFVPKGKDPVLHRAAQARYRQKNREKVRDDGRRRYQANPERFRQNYLRRVQRERALGPELTDTEKEQLYAAYDYHCLGCRKRQPDILLTADHVVPVAKGGIHALSNRQPLCITCNKAKQDKIIDFRPLWPWD